MFSKHVNIGSEHYHPLKIIKQGLRCDEHSLAGFLVVITVLTLLPFFKSEVVLFVEFVENYVIIC